MLIPLLLAALPPSDGPLSRFLHGITIGPVTMDLSLPAPVGHADIHLDELMCTDLTIAKLSASTAPQPPLALSFDIELGYLSCQTAHGSTLKVMPLGHPSWGPGVMHVTLGNMEGSKSAKIATTLTLDIDGDGLPVAVHFGSSDVKLDGSIAITGEPDFGRILQPVINAQVEQLELELQKNLTHLLEVTLSERLTHALSNLSTHVLRPLLEVPTAPHAEGHVAHDAIVWSNSSAIELLDVLLNEVVGTDGPFGLNGLAKRLTGGSGVADLSGPLALPRVLALNLSSLGALQIALLDARVAGLDQLKHFELLTPGDAAAGGAHSLGFALGTASLGVQALANFTLLLNGSVLNGSAPITAPPLTEALQVEAGLGNASALATIFAAINASLDVAGALAEPGCIAAAVLNASVRALQLNASLSALTTTLTLSGTLEKNLSSIFNHLFELFGAVANPILPKLLAGFSAGPLRGKLNDELSARLDGRNATCPPATSPPPPPPPPSFAEAVDWTTVDVLVRLDELVDEHGAQAINLLITALLGNSSNSTWVLGRPLNVTIDASGTPLGTVTLTVLSASADGLATVENVTLLEPLDGPLLRSGISSAGLRAATRVRLDTGAPWLAAGVGGLEIEISLELAQLVLSSTALLAVNRSGWGDLQLQQALNGSCLNRQLLAKPSLSDLQMNLESISLGLTGDNWGYGAPQPVQLPSRAFALPQSLVKPLLRRFVNPLLAHLTAWLLGTSDVCVAPPPYARGSSLIDWRESALMQALHGAVDSTGARLNGLIANWTQQTGTLELNRTLELNIYDVKLGEIGIEMDEIHMGGLDGLFNVTIAQADPIDPIRLNNELGVGQARRHSSLNDKFGKDERLPLTLGMRLQLTIDGQPHTYSASAKLLGALLQLDTELGIDLGALGELPLRTLASHPGCALVLPLNNLSLTQTSGMYLLNELNGEADLELTSLAVGITTSLRLPPGSSTANSAFVGAILTVLDELVAARLAAAQQTCLLGPAPAPPPAPHDEELSALDDLILILCGLVLACALACGYLRWRALHPKASTRARNVDAVNSMLAASRPPSSGYVSSPWIRFVNEQRLPPPAPSRAPPRYDRPSTDSELERERLDNSSLDGNCPTALEPPVGWVHTGEAHSQARATPRSHQSGGSHLQPMRSRYDVSVARRCSAGVRWLFTLACLGTMGLFAFGHASNGATMSGIMYLSGEHVQLPGLFYFTLWGSIRDEWNAGTYFLALLVAVASLLWPFIKLALQLLLWWLPPSWMGLEAHGFGVRLLDGTCKFALTNIQMVVLLMVGLHFEILIPSAETIVPLLGLSVEVAPDTGTYAFISAMVPALVLGHVHAYMHRTLLHPLPPGRTRRARAGADGGAGKRARLVPLRRTEFESLLCWSDRRLPGAVQLGVALGLVACLLGVSFGLIMDVIDLEVVGVVGALLGEKRRTTWSVASMAKAISSVTTLANPTWLAILQAGFYFTIVGMPVLWLLLAFSLWMLPLRPEHLHRLLMIVEAAAAWAMLDVFVVILLTSLLSLDQFAQYTLSDDPTVVELNTFLAANPELGNLLPAEPVVLGVQPTLLRPFWLLFSSGLASVPLCVFVTHCANHAFEQQRAHAAAMAAAAPHYRVSD